MVGVFGIIDAIQERVQQRQSMMQPQRVLYLKEPQKPRAVALFGASPDAFALDWVTYKIPRAR